MASLESALIRKLPVRSFIFSYNRIGQKGGAALHEIVGGSDVSGFICSRIVGTVHSSGEISIAEEAVPSRVSADTVVMVIPNTVDVYNCPSLEI